MHLMLAGVQGCRVRGAGSAHQRWPSAAAARRATRSCCFNAAVLSAVPVCWQARSVPRLARRSEGHEMALVFEDDFLLLDRGGDFMQRLQRVMEQMPEDWQVRRAGRSHRP